MEEDDPYRRLKASEIRRQVNGYPRKEAQNAAQGRVYIEAEASPQRLPQNFQEYGELGSFDEANVEGVSQIL